jgi:uncharacterized protein YndB with AHSA1/START domain
MGLVLQLRQIMPARRAAVWTALTEPAELARWWGPHGFTVPEVAFDPRVDGGYRIAMQPPDGELFHLAGEFRRVDPPAGLAYTFRWDPPDTDDRETLVTLTLADLGDRTELQLTQAGFATDARRALHEGGWTDSLARLDEVLRSAAAQAGTATGSRTKEPSTSTTSGSNCVPVFSSSSASAASTSSGSL